MSLLIKLAQIAKLLLIIVAGVVGVAFFGWLLGWGFIWAYHVVRDPKKLTRIIDLVGVDGEAGVDMEHDHSNWTRRRSSGEESA